MEYEPSGAEVMLGVVFCIAVIIAIILLAGPR